jgi:hypothetical protein
MSNIKINDVPQRIQYSATGGQTQFTIPFPFFSNSYVYVWLNGVQIFQGGAADEYVVTGAGSPSGGLVTLNTAATLNDIVTIEGIMPIDRTSIYSATISNLTGSDLNGDFNREVVMLQQLNTTQSFMQLQYAPWAEISQDLDVTTDRYIPLLPALGAWRMNAAGTAIETFQTPTSGGLAPDDGQYLIQTADVDLPDAIALDTFASGLMVNVFGSGFSAARTIENVANQTTVTNGNGVSGNPAIGLANNAVIPGTAGMGIPVGTTAERVIPTPPSIGLRYNTDLFLLEYYDASLATWQQLEESNDVAQLIADLASHSAGLGASMIGLQNQTGVTNKTVQDLANAGIIAKTDNGTLTNGQFLSALSSGALGVTTATGVLLSRVHTGTANQITVTNGDMQSGNPTWSFPVTLIAPGTFQVGNLLFSGNTMTTQNVNGDFDVVLNGAGLFNINTSVGVDEIINDPTMLTASAQNLATALSIKSYVDSLASGITFLSSAVAASTANYVATYNNGAAGVGATLTNNAAQAAFAIDGLNPTVGQRVLIKDQTNAEENGVYYVSIEGDGSTDWELTRVPDYDTAAEIVPGTVIPINLGGTENGGSSWLQTSTVTTVGTDPIDWIQFTATLPISMENGGTGANLTAANGGIVYSSAAQLNILAPTATANQILRSGSNSAPNWSTATYPGTINANDLMYGSSSNVIGTLATGTGVIAALGQNVTGSGGIVLDTSPILTTPNIGTPSAGVLTNCTGLPVAGGGTGNSTFTAYSVICAGTTATGAFQNVSGVGTAGQILTSNGAGQLPTWQANSGAGFPSGTRMIFQQTSAPTGWTKDTTAAIDNGALRTVTGSVSTGGSVNFTTAFASQTPTGTNGATTLTAAQIPAHTHAYGGLQSQGFSSGNSIIATTGSVANTGNGTGGGGSHTHSFTGDAINLAVKYYDVIIASKD